MDGGQNAPAVQTLICGLVTDGTYSLFDGLYLFATNSATNAKLNWAQNNYNLTQSGSITYTANSNAISDGTTGYLATGYNTSTAGGHFALNSNFMGVCHLNNRTTVNGTTWSMGVFVSGVSETGISPLDFTNGSSFYNNNTTALGVTTSTALGSWINYRTASGTWGIWYNNASGNTASTTSLSLPNANLMIMTLNSANPTSNLSVDNLAYAFFGGGGSFTTSTLSTIYNRLHTYLSAVGAPAGC